MRDSVIQQTNSFQIGEQPSVSLGDSNGKLADFQKLPDGRWTVLMYFRNSGRSSALHFLVNFHTSLKVVLGGSRHLFRFTKNVGDEEEGDPGTANIPASSLFKKYLPPEWELSDEEHQLVTDATKNHFLFVFGNMEYCDEFGIFHCDAFEMAYNASFKNFITTAVTEGRCVTPKAPDGWHELPVCENSDEQKKSSHEPYRERPPWTPPADYHPLYKFSASGPVPWPTIVPTPSP